MRRLTRRFAVAALAILALSGFPGFSAQARELVRERFEQTDPAIPVDNAAVGRDGTGRGFSMREARGSRIVPGAYLDLPVIFDEAASRGAISFDLQRKAGNVTKERRTLFELLDAAGNQILEFRLQWQSDAGPPLPMIFINGEDYWTNGASLWSQQILFDREVAPGQWIHIDLAWDDSAGRYGLYVDGRPQDVAPKSYLKNNSKALTDRRLDVNARLRWGWAKPSPVSKPFSYFLSRVRTFRIGVDSHVRKPQAVAVSYLSHSVLDDFVVLAGEWPRGLAGGPSQIRSVSDDTFKVARISGRLVAGDTVSVELKASPGGKASFDMGIVKGVPMDEVAATAGGPGVAAVDNGTYRASYTIRPGDDYADGHVVGHFVSSDNVAAEAVASESKWTIDTKPVVTFAMDKKDLPADSATKARVKLVAKDANGNPVKGRHLKLTLATTDEYTGTVGAGDFGQNVGATVETRWKGETDSWGEVEFEYKAGFAAKTVILTAKDLDSGGVTVDYVTAFKEASIDIALTAPVSRAAGRRGLQYIVKVEASRTELTADGRSRSVIRATVLDPNGAPMANDPVVFTLSSENGTLRTIKGTTDSSGVATAEYVAGKKIGIVVVTATASLRNASGSVSITLLSDAPAKIILKARPQTLPADGFSRADLEVKVTDINDNPNKDTTVEFKIGKGGGKLDAAERLTDRFGDAANRYTSGTAPGVASIVATVRSKVPTEAELAKAMNVLFAPYSESSEDIKIQRWLKRAGETALKEEPIVEYTIGRSATVYQLKAPYDCRIDFQYVEYWDDAQTGDTLARITAVVIPGSMGGQVVAPKAPRRR